MDHALHTTSPSARPGPIIAVHWPLPSAGPQSPASAHPALAAPIPAPAVPKAPKRRRKPTETAADRRLAEAMVFRDDCSGEPLWDAGRPRPPTLRQRAEQAVEALLALLDEVDGDPDLQADGTESDADIADEPHDDGDDAEPWLGSLDREVDQSQAWRTVESCVMPIADGEIETRIPQAQRQPSGRDHLNDAKNFIRRARGQPPLDASNLRMVTTWVFP